MKLGPVNKHKKRNKSNIKKNLTMTSCQQIVMSLSIDGYSKVWGGGGDPQKLDVHSCN